MKEAERELEQARRSPSHDDSDAWPAWQQAATEAWLATHPGDRWLLRPQRGHQPTVDEIVRRAERLAHATDGVRSTRRIEPDSVERDATQAQIGFLHEQVAGLYSPIDDAIEAVRSDGSPIGLETLVRFLEADVYCFRSGYVTADVLQVLKQAKLPEQIAERLRRVILAAVDGHDRREFRSFSRLAVFIADDWLRGELCARSTSQERRIARHAQWVLFAVAAAGARTKDRMTATTPLSSEPAGNESDSGSDDTQDSV